VSKEFPPLTPSQVRDEGIVQSAKTLADLGIFKIQTWRLQGRCPWHGKQEFDLEDTEAPEIEGAFILCKVCHIGGSTRWPPVDSRAVLL